MLIVTIILCDVSFDRNGKDIIIHNSGQNLAQNGGLDHNERRSIAAIALKIMCMSLINTNVPKTSG